MDITIEANLKVVDFLDITMDLESGIFKPYMKPNNTPLYIHRLSNHPPSVIKNIPKSVNRRLSSVSSNKEVFVQAAPPYQKALSDSGYNFELKFDPTINNNNNNNNNAPKNKRKRNIIWFLPPFNMNVSTNIGAKFLKLVDSCFPPGHPLRKLYNRNNMKVGYRCMPNLKQTIDRHNRKVIRDSENKVTEETKKQCNCQASKVCPLDGKCNVSGVVYHATVTRTDIQTDETYVGLTEGEFKKRYRNHLSSFKLISKKNDTTLSGYIWELQKDNIPYNIKWKIIDRGKGYSPTLKTCQLCIKEKWYIIFKPESCSLNSRDEFVGPCLHKKKLLLGKL